MTKLQKADKTGKLKVGFYGITGCAGCLLSFIFNEDELLDLVDLVELKAFPFVKEVNPNDKFDYVFMEGLVADKGDLEELKKLEEEMNRDKSLQLNTNLVFGEGNINCEVMFIGEAPGKNEAQTGFP